ncbi:LrgB family protein [Virgibacillus sp. 179-BFC.A HS]|uniref:LrgB family protein n=1 Tax=Tigheibacillus jepli TaxID=3035914 RepID=A0ABU5CDJ2_9BACI|nr:LrgB family protein [Virgibacillus sp. 179-BFC.A HS]MDY0404400.1 LrgB family protein [Virgibacillus sp. 179-BFC.A HS]
MTEGVIALGMFTATVIAYLIAVSIHRRFGKPFTVPVLIATIIMVAGLLIFHIPYDTYMEGGKWIDRLLGPAVVALAYPLYQHRNLLKELMVPILVGTSVGAAIGLASGILLAKWAGFDTVIIHSLAPKSVTTPVAMVLADSQGGIKPLAAVFVMIAGIGGAIFSTWINKIFHVHHYIGWGVGAGTASHAIGTARAMEVSGKAGSASTVAMSYSTVFVSIIFPLFIWLFA